MEPMRKHPWAYNHEEGDEDDEAEDEGPMFGGNPR